MAQFRTCADIFDEILQKSGEVTNGNSAYEAQVVTYANKAHHAIIGGGNLFSYRVDEDWKWARAKNPIVLELLPAYTLGSLTVVNSDINITFSTAPSVSVEGWYLQLDGYRTVYRITENSAGVASAVIDSALLQPSGSYNFRVYKLDYEIFPSYLYVDSFNDKLSFEETSGTTLNISLTHGSYTPNGLVSHVVSKLNGSGASVYTGSYDSVLKEFTLTSDLSGGGNVFTLLGATGVSVKRSSLSLLGFDQKDYATAGSHTSSYIINGICRLVAPFKVFSNASTQPFIKSLDPEELEETYPIALTNQKTPTNFAIVEERNDGTFVVRFNAYPEESRKTLIDWVPIPKDLQDNAASFPLIPRKDVDVLIHAASAFIHFDKEDDKFQSTFGFAKAGLESMEKKNRSQSFRTGENYAQIVPRADLVAQERRLTYGYEVQGSSTAANSVETAQQMIPITLTYADFQTGGLTNTVTARTLPANRSLFSIIIKHSVAFSGGSISALTLDVGSAGNNSRFILGFDAFQAVADSAQDSVLTIYYPATSTPITVTATAVGDNLSALTAGSVRLYFQENIVEA